MTADVLVYGTPVPVGGGPNAAMELARDLAQQFNNPVPDRSSPPRATSPRSQRVMDLWDRAPEDEVTAGGGHRHLT